MNRGRSRYIVKNNNNVTRMDYLLRLFPDARFLLIVRDPVAHIGSMVKQQRIFMEIGARDPKMIDTLAIVGHWEFGPRLAFLNVGREGTLARIRGLWAEGREVEAWAVYWASIYGFVADRLDVSPALVDATLAVRYEKLCSDSGSTIDSMLRHADFAEEPFADIHSRYVDELSLPSYYKPDFTDEQLDFIRKETDPVAARFE